MSDEQTVKVIERFNEAFNKHDPSLLRDLLAPGCVLENSGPAPQGSRHEGYEECLEFWSQIAANEQMNFIPEEIWAADGRAVSLWKLVWGPGPDDYVRGVNITRVQEGLIVESFGYVKS